MIEIHRVEGDHGSLARIRVRLTDRDGEPITVGSTKLRAHGLWEREATHAEDGWWYVDPEENDLVVPEGRNVYRVPIEWQHQTITIPAEYAAMLVIRRRGTVPV